MKINKSDQTRDHDTDAKLKSRLVIAPTPVRYARQRARFPIRTKPKAVTRIRGAIKTVARQQLERVVIRKGRSEQNDAGSCAPVEHFLNVDGRWSMDTLMKNVDLRIFYSISLSTLYTHVAWYELHANVGRRAVGARATGCFLQ